jgi:hypothetical protein
VDEAGPEVAAMRLGFADRLLEVIDSGRRTATYKLALLLALIDLCSRRSDGDGHAPSMLYTKDIAEQVVMIYWPQVIPYKPPGASDALVLSKISLPRATIISAVRQFREMAEAAGAKWSPRAPAGRKPAAQSSGSRRAAWPAQARSGNVRPRPACRSRSPRGCAGPPCREWCGNSRSW